MGIGRMRQLSRDEAIAFHDSEKWKTWTHEQIATFQMNQECLCIPFGVFHEAIEKALGRPVWTHELGLNHEGLKLELEGKVPSPTMEQIMGLLPADKAILIVA